jgi:ubiquinone/menaquinone biosynthesis C-methylase UbiE
LAEFTGERVVPGQVDQDLFNEHIARYYFAARLSRNKRVLDLACGTGYGSAELASWARSVVGLDVSGEAIAHAREHFSKPNLTLINASCVEVPFPDATFDLITAFEVIEHLEDWPMLLREAKRLLAPGGQFVVSTPNKSYYAESRRLIGDNPFHVHEFEFQEFHEALSAVFPHISLFTQNHCQGVAFQPLKATASAEVRLEGAAADPEQAHFFVAVCALAPQTGAPTYVYLPTAANVLREREHHIARLEKELVQKNEWLVKSQSDHKELVDRHRSQTEELEARNRWAEDLNLQLAEAGRRQEALQQELRAEQQAALATVAAYEEKIAELERDNAAKTDWATTIEQRMGKELEEKSNELAECVKLLDKAEQTVEERTLWAQSLDGQVRELEHRLNLVQGSRWHRVGRRLGFGPEVDKS